MCFMSPGCSTDVSTDSVNRGKTKKGMSCCDVPVNATFFTVTFTWAEVAASGAGCQGTQ